MEYSWLVVVITIAGGVVAVIRSSSRRLLCPELAVLALESGSLGHWKTPRMWHPPQSDEVLLVNKQIMVRYRRTEHARDDIVETVTVNTDSAFGVLVATYREAALVAYSVNRRPRQMSNILQEDERRMYKILEAARLATRSQEVYPHDFWPPPPGS